MGLLRYQVFLTYGVVFCSVWYYFVINVERWNLSSNSRLLVWLAPFWGVILLGLSLIGRLIYGVLTYQDCSDASLEIEQQILEARADAKRRKLKE